MPKKRAEKACVEDEKKREGELKKTEKRRDKIYQKEDKHRHVEENKLEKEYAVGIRTLTSAQNQMYNAITDSDMVGVQVSTELIEVPSKNCKQLLSIGKNKIKIRICTDIAKKRKVAFKKLFKTVKKTKQWL